MILKWSCGQIEKISLQGLIAARSLSLARCQDLSPSPNASPNSVTAHCSLLGNDSGGSRPPGPSFNLSFFPAQQMKTPLEQKKLGKRRSSALNNCIAALFQLTAALRGHCWIQVCKPLVCQWRLQYNSLFCKSFLFLSLLLSLRLQDATPSAECSSA